ncbi:HTH-type transcriptional regulator GltR [Ruegeria denitrificans]|uniref:HTH-type transcriptional regulator GltR n=1 Tax=Ruegeria denitrificans TaxID=1715692 RepID=A0A0P1I6B9_9RHOB|nr:LysR family transcriptional regulator [Ruegeria denitrificans]CUJ93286.1 HTH-type transcriptional regulator GltR [Ruegeria denitrificans]
MNERLEIDALRALLAISTHGGVTRAAEHLSLSQSAVSHKIRRLELALDCSLLARRAGGPLFTEAGQRLCNYARRITELHDEALSSLGKKPLTGTIRLGMTEDTATSDIARILGRFTRLYPEIHVRTRTSQSLNVQAWLKVGELDVAVMQIFRQDVLPDDLILFEDTLHWVKAPEFRLDLSSPVPFLSFDSQCFYRQWGMGNGPHRFDTILECPSAAGIQSAVRSGLGVALLNGLHVTPDMEVIDDLFPAPPRIVFVARTHLKRRNQASAALIQEIRKEVETTWPLSRMGQVSSSRD